MTQKLLPAGLRYVANEFACMVDDPVHKDRIRQVVRAALDGAANEIEFLRDLVRDLRVELEDLEEEFVLGAGEVWRPANYECRKKVQAVLERAKAALP